MKFASRQQLEAMSTSQLIAFADKYGIDIPSDLDRRFIIGELLEAEEDFDSSEKNRKSKFQTMMNQFQTHFQKHTTTLA